MCKRTYWSTLVETRRSTGDSLGHSRRGRREREGDDRKAGHRLVLDSQRAGLAVAHTGSPPPFVQRLRASGFALDPPHSIWVTRHLPPFPVLSRLPLSAASFVLPDFPVSPLSLHLQIARVSLPHSAINALGRTSCSPFQETVPLAGWQCRIRSQFWF
jgi:hypothetical protein